MTECSQVSFSFAPHFSRRVEADFSAGQISSDGGALLLREVERKINLLGRLADCFQDGRMPLLVKHRLPEMLAQRIYGLALGYEDLNDHEQLRSDPLLGVLSGKRELEDPLAGKSTLNRLELAGRTARYHKISYSSDAIDQLLVDIYLESHATAPERIVLDLDATDIPSTGISRSASSMAITTATVTCRCTSSPAINCSVCACGPPTGMRPPVRSMK